jgi:surfeit locus 1 family protein
MSRRSRLALFLLCAAAAAAVFVRLGFWQLSRLHERRARNAAVAARLAEPSTTPASLPTDTATLHYRRVRVTGRADYAHEFVLANRSRDGSPGVNVVTPVRVAGVDRAVLVNRGWVYSPNGAQVDLAAWREPDSLDAEGWVEVPTRTPGVARLPSAPRALRWLDTAAVAHDAGYPVTPYYVVLDPPAGPPPRDRPVRLDRPALDEGPHKSYAVQWFCFAAVAIVGAGIFVRSSRR